SIRRRCRKPVGIPLQRKPAQGLPVVAMKVGPGPDKAFTAEPLNHPGVLGDIRLVVEIDEIITPDRAIGRQRKRDQADIWHCQSYGTHESKPTPATRRESCPSKYDSVHVLGP